MRREIKRGRKDREGGSAVSVRVGGESKLEGDKVAITHPGRDERPFIPLWGISRPPISLQRIQETSSRSSDYQSSCMCRREGSHATRNPTDRPRITQQSKEGGPRPRDSSETTTPLLALAPGAHDPSARPTTAVSLLRVKDLVLYPVQIKSP